MNVFWDVADYHSLHCRSSVGLGDVKAHALLPHHSTAHALAEKEPCPPPPPPGPPLAQVSPEARRKADNPKLKP